MLPLMEKELVEKQKWIDREELLDFYAVSQSTPGVIAVNTATFIGHKCNGVVGSLFAIVGMMLPSIVIISVLSLFLVALKENEIFQKMFKGIRVTVGVLILYAVYKIRKGIPKSKYGFYVTLAAFILSFYSFQTFVIILSAALVGLLMYEGEKND
jgi:chromate transporter